MSKNVDKRTERTRRHLQSTLHALLEHRDYADITVEAICRHGKVGRSTFYTHFRGKDDLKRSALEQLRQELIAAQLSARAHVPTLAFAFSRTLFKHAKAHLRDYRSLVHGPGGHIVLSTIKKIVSELVRTELLSRQPAQTKGVVDLEAA